MAKDTYELYGLEWQTVVIPLWREMKMVQLGGRWKGKNGMMIGNGTEFHFKLALKLLWPEIVHHRWTDLFIEHFLTKRTVVVIGPASSGKTFMSAFCALLDYYCFPEITTVMCCSTTRERLEDRVWKEVKKLHRVARQRFSWIPGHLIEGRLRIVTDHRSEAAEGRDFGAGLVGVACKKGESYVGLGDFAGFKNKRVILIGDELSLLPKAFVDAISNLDKNPKFLCIGLGNPKDTTDALGVLGEPAAHLGGWDGSIDQSPFTKVWEIRRREGVCIQLVGTDSPNLDGKLGADLITQEAIDRDVAFYGTDSVWFTMMDLGRMPRGQGSKRVITRQMCEKFGARNEPNWLNSNRTKIAFLDAAYRGVGGDRCVFGVLEFGEEMPLAEDTPSRLVTALVNQPKDEALKRKVIHLQETMLVPISNDIKEMPEDQIVAFVMKQCNERGIPPENFFFDAGMRTSLVSAFGRLWSPQVQSIDFGGKPSERKVSYDLDILCRDHYSKFVTELWFNVRHVIEAGQFRGMTDDVMLEFASREWGIVGANKTEVEPKEKMKAKTGRSPDLADAVVCGVWGAIVKGFVIRRLPGDKRQRMRDDRWKRDLKEKSAGFWKAGQMATSTPQRS
jgi:hypothetical protein